MRHESISKDKVKQTEAFKNLSPMLQSMVVKRNNMVNSINHAYSVIKNIGLDEWRKVNQIRYYNREIVEEIIRLEND